jgi:hypothetical protein
MPIMPVFVFFRRRHIELETGLILAGQLVVDIPRHRHKLSKRQDRLIANILRSLTAEAERMPDDAIIFGWPNGRRPDDADNTLRNDELMNRWIETRLVIALRIDPRTDGMMRVDSDMLRQMGLAHGPSGEH